MAVRQSWNEVVKSGSKVVTDKGSLCTSSAPLEYGRHSRNPVDDVKVSAQHRHVYARMRTFLCYHLLGNPKVICCSGQLSKHKRHKDKTAVLDFWDGVDNSIRSRKLNLVF